MGLYNFVDNQWWNPLIARRIVIRGSLGEIVDDTVTRLTPEGPVTSPIVYRRTGVDMNLEGNEVVHASFDGRVIYRNPWVGTNLSEDDIAVASHLAAVGLWARDGGPGALPPRPGLPGPRAGPGDRAVRATGADVRVEREVWA